MDPNKTTRARPARLERRRFGLLLLAFLLVAGTAAFVWRHTVVTWATGSSASGGDPVDPAIFASGACVAYQPTAGSTGTTVFLDAGHGGVDPGGIGTTRIGRTIHEADETLPLELDVMALLRAKGFRVVVSRTTNSTVLRLGPADRADGVLTLRGAHDDVAARDICANDGGANLMVGIYYNAGSPHDAGSLTAYDPDRPFSAANRKLANLVQDDVLAQMNSRGWGIPNDGVLPDAGLGSLNGNPASGGLAAQAAAYGHLLLIGPAKPGFFSTPSEMPGVIVEPLYITDPFEGSIADSSNGQKVIAQGIATAVEQYVVPGSTPRTTGASGG